MKNKPISVLLAVFASLILFNCSSNEKSEDGEVVKKKRREISMDKRAEEQKTKLFGNLGNNKSTTFEFSTSNVLWRASLESLNFLPLNTVDYSGGVIVSDWYSPNLSNESIKIEIRFLSSELKASSVMVKAFKKICETSKCQTKNMDNSFNKKIKDKIITKAREIKISDEINKKK